MIIGKLVAKAQKRDGANAHIKVNEARLGMAMKECFKISAGNGWDIWSKNRKAFIDEVVKTYQLFTEIVEKLEGNVHDTQ